MYLRRASVRSQLCHRLSAYCALQVESSCSTDPLRNVQATATLMYSAYTLKIVVNDRDVLDIPSRAVMCERGTFNIPEQCCGSRAIVCNIVCNALYIMECQCRPPDTAYMHIQRAKPLP